MLSIEYPYKVEISSSNIALIIDWLSEHSLVADEHYMFYQSNSLEIFRFKNKSAAYTFQLRWGGVSG